jgi:hypothetical protein
MDPISPAPSPTSGARQYEFSAAENTVFGGLAGKMRFVGVILMVVGVLYLLLGGLVVVGAITGESVPVAQKVDGAVTMTSQRLHVGHSLGYFVGGIIYLLMGMWTGNSAAAFRRIVDTQGSDISHLMDAVTNLHKLYTLQFWLILIGLIVMLVALVTVIVLLATR